MIQYDVRMASEDLVAYWSGGYVILDYPQETPRYQLAQVINADGRSVLLRTVAGAEAKVSRADFFKTVILHRPYVNLVQHEGVIYRLTWAPPDRGIHKYIHNELLFVRRIAPINTPDPEIVSALAVWQRTYFTGTRLGHGDKRAPPGLFSKQAKLPCSMDLLMHAMNNPVTTPPREIVHSLMTQPVGSVRLLSTDEYAIKSSAICVSVFAGSTELLHIDTNGQVQIAPTIKTDSCWLPHAVRLAAKIERSTGNEHQD